MLNILQKGNQILETKAQKINLEDIKSAKVKNLIKEMKETLNSRDDGAALAAPQVGESLRLFIISKKIFLDEKQAEDLVFINPEIIKESKDREWLEEGCLSVNGVYGKVNRAKKCIIKAYDEKGDVITRGGSGLLSQIFQHEVDHLNGILFVDKAKDLESTRENTQKI